MDGKHSEGPWKVTGECSTHITVKSAKGITVARVKSNSGLALRREGFTAPYNANLIVASPDLLKAANKIMANARDSGACFDDEGNMYDDYQELEDAINKAERGF